MAVAGAMFVAAVSALAVMMVALRLRIIGQHAAQERLHALVRAAVHARIQLNAGRRQRRARAAADAAADQGVHALRLQKSGQRAVAFALHAHNLLGDDLAVLDLIELELLAVSEVLKHLSVCIRYRDFHGVFLLFCSSAVGHPQRRTQPCSLRWQLPPAHMRPQQLSPCEHSS